MATQFTLSSPAFESGQPIPRRFTCEGDNLVPPLAWNNVPDRARSFALIVEDPDAPRGTFTHWIQWNIPGEARALDDDSVGTPGKNDFQGTGYGGPCPPPQHRPHRYYFHLYALDVPALDLPPGAARPQLEAALEGHVVADGVLMGRFQR